MKTSASEPHPSSFRDPSGFLFLDGGVLLRQVNEAYREDYDLLLQSGLYQQLVDSDLLIPHRELTDREVQAPGGYRIIRPEQVGFVSHPYEWSFSQLKDAARTTLRIQKMALARGMSLKDASAFNIQFHHGKAILIDTLSFEQYQEGEPWVAYRQFCQHFLAPLALMAYVDVRLGQLLRVHIDGVPLDLTASLLPARTKLKPGLLLHLHLHASSQKRLGTRASGKADVQRSMARTSLLGLIDSLLSAVNGLRWQPRGTPWVEYGGMTHYSPQAADHKRAVVEAFLDEIKPSSVWDLGANVGTYSRVASDRGIPTIAFDVDPAAVERSYLEAKRRKERHLLPLVLDVINPSPALGWDHQERASLAERGPADAVMALALVHHLAIANNVPLLRLARFFRRLGRWLIIEFVPKEDPQAQKLLAWRKDIFEDYTQERFAQVLGEEYEIRRTVPIEDTPRTLYLMESRDPTG
jgi:hypothetical protein